jgi:hypothetical protein
VAADAPPLPPGGTIRLNAWTTGAGVASPLAADRAKWISAPSALQRGGKLAPQELVQWKWQDPRLGWGLVLPDRPGMTDARRARPDDAPEPIQQLFRDRPGAKVLRYRAGKKLADFTLRDATVDGHSDPPIAAPIGTAPGEIPAYLLIVATPAEIPWHVQYALNLIRRVGRLDLDEDGLANYVTALRDGWKDSGSRYDSPVVWSVDHGGADITALMRDAIGAPVAEAFRGDAQMPGTRFIDGRVEHADGAALVAALAQCRPSVVVTTSHGMTGPLGDADQLRAQLGLPVDAAHRVVGAQRLLDAWAPDGAVWYAHACCSAGSDAPSQYQGLFDPASMAGRVLADVAALGARTAPLPQRLLGAAKPLRAFIGQVEPTFDWTLVFPQTRQRLTGDLRTALYTELCAGRPVGYAFDGTFQPVGGLLFRAERARGRYSDSPPGPSADEALEMALYHKVTALNRAATVLLGDPTVALPVPLAGQPPAATPPGGATAGS